MLGMMRRQWHRPKSDEGSPLLSETSQPLGMAASRAAFLG